MKKYLFYLIRMNKVLNILFILSLILLLLIEFVLTNIPEFFNGGAKIGTIVSNLSLAFIASYIFYFIVVHIKKERDVENIKEYIISKTQLIISSAKSLFENMKKESTLTDSSFYPSEEELLAICARIDPRTNAPLVLGRVGNYANWIQFFDYYIKKSEKAINDIFIFMPYLDTELVKRVFAIQDCVHFQTISFLVKVLPIKNTDLSSFTNELYEYFLLINNLEEYFNRQLKKASRV